MTFPQELTGDRDDLPGPQDVDLRRAWLGG